MNQQQLNIDNLFQILSKKFGEIQLQVCILEAKLMETKQELMEYKNKEEKNEQVNNVKEK